MGLMKSFSRLLVITFMLPVIGQILVASDALQLPGGFTSGCMNRKTNVPHNTRFVYNVVFLPNNKAYAKTCKKLCEILRFSLWYDVWHCKTRYLRHAICMFGLEDVQQMANLPHFFFNKIVPDFDFGAAFCWSEVMFNRSYLEPKEVTSERMQKNRPNYLNLPQVN